MSGNTPIKHGKSRFQKRLLFTSLGACLLSGSLAAAADTQVGPAVVTASDVQLAESIVRELSSGRKICGTQLYQLTGSRIYQRPCFTGEDLSVEQWTAVYADLQSLKDRYECQQAKGVGDPACARRVVPWKAHDVKVLTR